MNFHLFKYALVCWLVLCKNAISQEGAAKPADTSYWIFLTTGKSSTTVPKAELLAMQKAHLDNFSRLFHLNKLSLAGPVSDPGKKIRGIVAVTASNESEMRKYFAEDPYVEEGYLKLEAYPITAQIGASKRDLSLAEMEEFQIAVLHAKASPTLELTPEQKKATGEYLQSIYNNEKLRLAIRMEDNLQKLTAVLIFRKQKAGVAEEWLQGLPPVAQGQWNYQLFPLNMSKGVLD